jgi:hypothetical protein
MKKLHGILMLLLSSVLLVSCQANKNENKDQNKEQTTQNESNKQEDSKKKEEANKKDSDSSNKSSSSTNIKTEDTQVIGSDEYGYVKVPKSWVNFQDINGGNDIQSSDTSAYNVVTLNIFRPSQLGISEAEYASIDPKLVANSVYTKHKNSQLFEKMSGTKSKIGGYDAYVINTLTKTGKYFVTYIFKADDGKIHYTSIEGDKDTVDTMIPLLEKSWSLKK